MKKPDRSVRDLQTKLKSKELTCAEQISRLDSSVRRMVAGTLNQEV